MNAPQLPQWATELGAEPGKYQSFLRRRQQMPPAASMPAMPGGPVQSTQASVSPLAPGLIGPPATLPGDHPALIGPPATFPGDHPNLIGPPATVGGVPAQVGALLAEAGTGTPTPDPPNLIGPPETSGGDGNPNRFQGRMKHGKGLPPGQAEKLQAAGGFTPGWRKQAQGQGFESITGPGLQSGPMRPRLSDGELQRGLDDRTMSVRDAVAQLDGRRAGRSPMIQPAMTPSVPQPMTAAIPDLGVQQVGPMGAPSPMMNGNPEVLAALLRAGMLSGGIA